jgi:hypothetical protein
MALAQEQASPRLRTAPCTTRDLAVDTWFERDRALVRVFNVHTQLDIACWFDDDVDSLVEAGFLDPADWEGSALEYVVHLRLADRA